jgi:hypothetical protein
MQFDIGERLNRPKKYNGVPVSHGAFCWVGAHTQVVYPVRVISYHGGDGGVNSRRGPCRVPGGGHTAALPSDLSSPCRPFACTALSETRTLQSGRQAMPKPIQGFLLCTL